MYRDLSLKEDGRFVNATFLILLFNINLCYIYDFVHNATKSAKPTKILYVYKTILVLKILIKFFTLFSKVFVLLAFLLFVCFVGFLTIPDQLSYLKHSIKEISKGH